MALSPQDRDQIRNVGLATALLTAGLVFLPGPEIGVPVGIMKVREQIQRLDKQIAREEDELSKEETRINRIPVIERELEERQPEIERYEARLPKSTKVPELFRDIDRFKQISGLNITIQTRLDPVDKGDYLELPIRIDANGPYDAIGTFINQLERNQRFAQIKELKISEKPSEQTSDTPDFTNHDATMRISTFLFRDQVVAAELEEKKAAPGAKEEAPKK